MKLDSSLSKLKALPSQAHLLSLVVRDAEGSQARVLLRRLAHAKALARDRARDHARAPRGEALASLRREWLPSALNSSTLVSKCRVCSLMVVKKKQKSRHQK